MSDQHGGDGAVAAARAHGVQTMFTLSGGHVFPLYDGAVRARPPMRILDVRHEQTAVFAAEATARLTRSPGLAVLTAGPGVTNGISAVTTAHFNGSPVVVLAGRAPDARWGSGSLQEFDHPQLLRPITKRAWTEHAAAGVASAVSEAFTLAAAPHRGPVFLDMSLEALFGPVPDAIVAAARPPAAAPPDPGAVAQIAGLLARSSRPVLVLGSDVWLGGAAVAARAAAEALALPVVANGQARGVLPAGHELLVTRARAAAFGDADLVIVIGTPLDFRLGYGEFGGRNGSPPASVIHVADAQSHIATHRALAGSAAGDLSAFFEALPDAVLSHGGASGAAGPVRGGAAGPAPRGAAGATPGGGAGSAPGGGGGAAPGGPGSATRGGLASGGPGSGGPGSGGPGSAARGGAASSGPASVARGPASSAARGGAALGSAAAGAGPAWAREWLPALQAATARAVAADADLLHSDARPIHPMRIYGELAGLLEDDAVVIGDGGDFVSYAGKYLEPRRPGGWLDPGPYGCLGTGLGYAIAARIARPAAQVVLLLGDGAAGFSLMDADTLVRHGLPVVMICGNNGAWGLEKHPMRALYGYDVAADLQPGCRYDQVVTALGGAGELVTEPDGIAPALRRAFASGVPYLVNVITDPQVAYPRSTTGV
jgi:thiamine pyrophosphate-dependent acetolactate synthase large subunit-like protein